MTEKALKLTQKQENFAQLYVVCGIASEAYRSCYSAAKMSNAAVWVEASRLLNHPMVSLRIKQLQMAAARRLDISIDSLSALYLQNARLAERLENPAAVKGSLDSIAKMHGLLDKKQHEHELNMTEKVMRHFFKLKDTTGLPAEHLPASMLNHPDLQNPDGSLH